MVIALGVGAVLIGLAVLTRWALLSRRRSLGSAEDRATYETLHTAALAAPALRSGLDSESVGRALPHLRQLIGARTVGITDTHGPLGWAGADETDETADLVAVALEHGRTQASNRVIVAPLSVEGRVVGTIVVVDESASAGMARTASEVAGWVSSQLELAELSASRTALMEAELRALRAQISPHFIYNALTAIASYVRTDPEHARELILEFADFTRYSFRRHGEFTTLAEELRSIDRYLSLERARFGDRLQVTVRVAPEVLPVTVPFLCLQPLVENAIQHGLEGRPGVGHVSIVAEDAGNETLVYVEDDGVGAEPDAMRQVLSGQGGGDSVGVVNVDERMRSVFGDEYGIVVETAPGAGTRVSLRIPKFHAGVHT